MITPFQQKVYEFVHKFMTEHQYAPTMKEIATGIGISPRSASLIHRSVNALVNARLLTHHKHGRRNISLAKPMALPLLGRIAAGLPIETILEHESIDVISLLCQNDHYVLQVVGDSMIDEGIQNKDFVICKRIEHAKEHDIIVALIDQQAVTLKRISYQIKNMITLIPANSHLKPKAYAPHRIQIQGVFIGLLRLK